MAEAGSNENNDNNDDVSSQQNCSAGVHIFDFKYSSETTAEDLRYLITKEIVTFLGNPYCIDRFGHVEKSTGSSNKKEEKIVPESFHRFLDLKSKNCIVIDSALNKKYLCLLLNNGKVIRLFCKRGESNFDNEDDNSHFPAAGTSLSSSGEIHPETIPFQVASDESYARTLQRSLNTNNLSQRRSYLSRSPIQTYNSAGPLSLHNRRELLQASIVLNPALQRFSPSIRARYLNLPYERDSRSPPRRRTHLQMSHIPLTSRSLIYTENNDIDMGESSVNVTDHPPLHLLDNITIVSLENAIRNENGINISGAYSDTLAPISMETVDGSVELIPAAVASAIHASAIPQEESFIHQTVSLPVIIGATSNEFENPSMVENDSNSNSNDSMKFPVSSLLNESRLKAGPSSATDSKIFEDSAGEISEESINYQQLPPTSLPARSSLNSQNNVISGKHVNWLPELGEVSESISMDNQFIVSIYPMESAFYFLDVEGFLWVWFNDRDQPELASFEWNRKDKITNIGCNMHRATVFFQSKTCCTFYDKCFSERNFGKEPALIKSLSHEPKLFSEFSSDAIIDIQCSTFFTAVLTATNKSFWWGLVPSSDRNPINHPPAMSNESIEIQIGDTVSLSKQDKNESGALVFNNVLSQLGTVIGKMQQDPNGSNTNASKIEVKCFDEYSKEARKVDVWDANEVVFLQDQHSLTGKVVSLDGPYAIVQHNDIEKTDQENLKVYFKSALERVECGKGLKVGRSRYQKYLRLSPVQVFSNMDYSITAISPTELGISLLVKRKIDGKAFLIYPSCLNDHYSSWFTCGRKELEPNETLTSESNHTIEYESTPSHESNLDIVRDPTDKPHDLFCMQSSKSWNSSFYQDCFNSTDFEENVLNGATSITELDSLLHNNHKNSKFARSVSMPAASLRSEEKSRGKRKLNEINVSKLHQHGNNISKPSLISVGNSTNQMTLLFDNKKCLYPIRFSCSLVNPPLLEILPMKSFVVLDRGFLHSKMEKILTVVAIPRVLPLTLAIRNGDKLGVERLLSIENHSESESVDSPKKKNIKLEVTNQEKDLSLSEDDMLKERSSGNQNIMHIAVANILKARSKSPMYGNIMETRNEEENAILQHLLDKPKIWTKIKTLLCQRDSHGCTPFMSAIMIQNLRGAYLILEAVKRNGRNESKVTIPADKELFQKAICEPSFSGFTPLHELIHSSSKKNASQQWYNTLKISNLPPSYSARLLLKLFKSQYPSVYRAVMPVPRPMWAQRSIRERLKGKNKKQTSDLNSSSSSTSTSKRGKLKINTNTSHRPTYVDLGARASGVPAGGRYTINRADILRANAKEGLVMFGNMNEMYQALCEMNNYSLLTKNDHSSGALLSVVQHLLHVQQYQESYASEGASTHHHTASSASSRNIFLSSDQLVPISSSSTSNDLFAQLSGSKQNVATATESSHSREETISKLAASGNQEGDSALGYFIKSYPRYSPSHLHKLFLNWRPCNRTNCKYNRHVGNLSITCQNEIDPQVIVLEKQSKDELLKSPSPPNRPGSSRSENPLLARRGLQYRGSSLVLNVRNKGQSTETGSPITPSIRLLDNLKFTPIEVTASTGLTPQMAHPYSAVEDTSNEGCLRKQSGYSPFFPSLIGNASPPMKGKKSATADNDKIVCNCHLSKARLLWNTTFQASVFYLAKSWPCIVGTLMHFKPLKEDSIGQKTFSLVDSSQLDIFTENLLLNPYSVLLEVFIKSLMDKFSSSKLSRNQYLLSLLHNECATNQALFKERTLVVLLPWLCIQRFVRSLVRQLSLNLSKNSTSDANLKYKIGRYANKTHSKKEARLKENLSLCLKAFSWISVIEILRAAATMLKPIRSGTVKAQAKGIIRDVNNAGDSFGRTALPTGVRMHIPTSGMNVSQRTFIRNASRRPSVVHPEIPSAANLLPTLRDEISEPSSSSSSAASSSYHQQQQHHDEDLNSDNEENSHLDDPYMTETSENTDRSDIDLNAVDWDQSQGITPNSSIAWAIDGHIRVRNEMASRLLPPPGLWQFNQQAQIQQQILNTPSIHAGYLYLARMFCRLVKEAVDLANSLRRNKGKEYGPSQGVFLIEPLGFDKKVEEMFMQDAQKLLDESWRWMRTVLDTLEEQLSVGEQFDTKHYVLRLKKTGADGDFPGLGRPAVVHKYGSTPDEYMMYLLKQDMGEAENSLPILDLFSYTHMTYILDAYLYMNKKKPLEIQGTEDQIESTNQIPSNIECTNHNFFKSALNISMALKDESLNCFKTHVNNVKLMANQITLWLDESFTKKCNVNHIEDGGTGEWNRVIDAFSTLFLTEGPGYERDSFLAVKAGASGRMSRFKRAVAAVRGIEPTSRPYSISSSQSENQALLVSVVRSKLLDDCISIFLEKLDNHPYGSLRVRFEGEEGTGPGVNRGLFAAFAASLKNGEKYKQWSIEFFAEYGNMPGQRGVFSPKPGKYNLVDPPSVYFGQPMSKEKRYEAFVAIGRFFGLTLWFNQSIPFILPRPILMYLLGKEDQITFDDLAFYDSALYQAFANMLSDALSTDSSGSEIDAMIDYDLRFEISIDGYTEELIPNGSQIPVTSSNVCEYIRIYTKFLLLTCRENELQGLRDGLLFVIPKELLDSLEPEDLQLLLSGGGEDVNFNRLKSIITFSNSRGCSREVLERYKTWFWKIVTNMSSSERQKLLYFATGSSVLPALDNRVGNNEKLSITVDIINSTNSSALPMSSTCGQRISLPLYTTKATLKHKLMQAIECQSYGLG